MGDCPAREKARPPNIVVGQGPDHREKPLVHIGDAGDIGLRYQHETTLDLGQTRPVSGEGRAPLVVNRTWADRWRVLFRIANRVEGMEVRWLGTSGMALLRRTDVLLLETTGRRTGKARRVVVAYWRDAGGSYVIGGGAGGMTKVDWVANLRANPHAHVWAKREGTWVRATELHDKEYDEVRAEAFRRWPDVEKYEAAGRPIPYFRLAPLGSGRALWSIRLGIVGSRPKCCGTGSSGGGAERTSARRRGGR